MCSGQNYSAAFRLFPREEEERLALFSGPRKRNKWLLPSRLWTAPRTDVARGLRELHRLSGAQQEAAAPGNDDSSSQDFLGGGEGAMGAHAGGDHRCVDWMNSFSLARHPLLLFTAWRSWNEPCTRGLKLPLFCVFRPGIHTRLTSTVGNCCSWVGSGSALLRCRALP